MVIRMREDRNDDISFHDLLISVLTLICTEVVIRFMD